MGRDQMRAGDADRQSVADQLRAALDEGRLDLHEYDERLQQAYGAKTYAELDVLLGDLPASVPAQRREAVPGRDDVTRRWLIHVWSSYLPVVAITVGIWLVTSILAGDPLYFWPMWVAGPWGLGLIYQTIGGLARHEPQKWQARLDKAERKKQLRKQRKALAAEALAAGELPPAKSAEGKSA